jgi:hypothetical protein
MADDDESLDEILSTPTKGSEAPQTEEQPAPGPARDEHGRFAPKEGEEPPNVEAEAEQPDAEQPEAEHNAPVAAVIAERRKAQANGERADKLERELAEMRGQMSVLMQRATQPAATPQPEPVKPPEFWDAPDKFVEHALTPFQQQLQEMRFMASRGAALSEFGKDTVAAAEAALKQALETGQMDQAAVKASLAKSRDPVGDVVRWHQNSPAVRDASLREKLRAEILAELKAAEPAEQQPSSPSNRNPIVKMPPSLNRIPAGHSAPERDESLDEVLSVPRRRA